jgi:uncharacterized protein (TIGR00255 family)
MTGFGHVTKSLDAMDIVVDVRTLNSRYFDFRARLGRELSSLEADLKKIIQQKLKRGRVDLFVEISPRLGDELELNEGLVRNFLALAERLSEQGIAGKVEIGDILNLPGALVPRADSLSPESICEPIAAAVTEAVEQVVESREKEGAALQTELRQRLGRLEELIESVSARSGDVSDYYQSKLSARVDELLEECDLDEGRLLQEVSYYAEKADTTEELTRLRSHLERFSEYLADDTHEAVGKTLDFLCQEMNREANTILSKAALVDVSGLAVEAKGEIEKIREQVQNVE